MSHNLFNRCCHFVYSDVAKMRMALKKRAIFTQNFAMNVTPAFVPKNLIGHILSG